MKKIFKKDYFSDFKIFDISECRKEFPLCRRSRYGELFNSDSKINVFISHKHNDIEEVKGVIGFLEKTYNVQCYIDELDDDMPDNTNKETAVRIKNKIQMCDKYILIATNGAILSRWCNWELGFSDAVKRKCNIAIIHMGMQDDYKGNEYYELYPYIAFCEKDSNHDECDYYVIDNDTNEAEKLEIWFRKRLDNE